MLKRQALSEHRDPQDQTTSKKDTNNNGNSNAIPTQLPAAENLHFGESLINLITHRLKSQNEHWNKIVKCHHLQDVLDQQNAFVNNAANDYARTGAKLIITAQQNESKLLQIMTENKNKP